MTEHNTVIAGDITQPDILHCPPDIPIAHAAKLMRDKRTSSILVKENETIIGIWTESDCTKLNYDDPTLFQRQIHDFMSTPVISIPVSTPFADIIRAFHRHKVRHLVVLNENGSTKGVISQSDVIKRQGIQHYLQLRTVGESYDQQLATVDALASLTETAKLMKREKQSAVLVKNKDEDASGIITERDLLKVLASDEYEQPLWHYASKPLITIESSQALLSAYLKLQRYRIRHLAVTSPQGDVIGLLSMQNILADIEHSYFQRLEALISERDHALHASQEHLFLAEKIIESSVDAIMTTDRNGVIISVNPAFTQVTGYKAREAIGKNANLLNSGIHDKSFYRKMWKQIDTEGKWQGEVWNRRKNGDVYPEWLTIVKIGGDTVRDIHYTGIFSDITERKLYENRIKSLAFYDDLTKLPNRRLFNDRLNIAISTAHRNQQLAAILFVDLDRFKQINDTLGHSIGDEVLRSAAKRISSSIKEGDTVARFGGDEFVILLTEMSSVEDIESVISRIYQQFNKPFVLDNKENYVTCSIGASIYPFHGTEPEALLKYADIAMYQTKKDGRNGYLFYQQDMHASLDDKLVMQNKLRTALKNNEFKLAYQPQICSTTGKFIGVEALLRWELPNTGMVSPAKFIPICEELGIIVDIERWVLSQACRQRKAWLQQGLDVGRIAVNVSPIHFKNNLMNSVLAALEHADLSPVLLEIEVTESCFIENTRDAQIVLEQLKKLGVEIALDDFGTGYSSLSYLTKLAINTLKIDGSFIRKTPTNEADCQMVKTIINMAQSLSLNIIAEGVETDAQNAFLTDNGCTQHQGYFYSKPIFEDEFTSQYEAIMNDAKAKELTE
ncbi:EAL domain-containing protein [Thalassotalea euphylliae]|uniref:EAL domain-containing protein n=1 Tax=Thalassotalea euphylliae TaxID=1655234 RepID=UPI00362AA043